MRCVCEWARCPDHVYKNTFVCNRRNSSRTQTSIFGLYTYRTKVIYKENDVHGGSKQVVSEAASQISSILSIVFDKQKRTPIRNPQLCLRESVLPYKESTIYLGTVFDHDGTVSSNSVLKLSLGPTKRCNC